MKQFCPRCSDMDAKYHKHGRFVRASDGRSFQRFRCANCKFIFSTATFLLSYRQKKRKLNPRIYELLCSGVSQRRIAILLNVSRRTVERKFVFLAQIARRKNLRDLNKMKTLHEVQFDDLETIEHTKMKPLSVVMAVEKSTRKIIGFSVSQMPAKGLLAKKSRKKYGKRVDLRFKGWDELFQRISTKMCTHGLLESDQNPHYPHYVRKWCSHARHETTIGRRGCVAGQGELKKVGFDPLFSLNHTFAMCRANINRLFRKTWCTTKRPDRLADHLELYAHYHNRKLTPAV